MLKYTTEERLKLVDEYIEKNRDAIIRDLMDISAYPSVKGEKEPGAPFGRDCKIKLEAVARLFEERGFKTVIREEGGYALSYYGEGDKALGLFSHADVVPVDGEWLITEPFKPIVKDGYIFGRGVNDDVSGIVEMLWAVMIIRDLGLPLKSRILFFNGTNEETGMEDIAAFVKSEEMPYASIIPDSGYPVERGQKSSMKVNLTSREPLSYIKSFGGGCAVNVVLGYAECAMPYSEEAYAELLSLTEGAIAYTVIKNGDSVILKAEGKQAHAAHPESGINAALLLAKILKSCSALPEGDRRIMERVENILSDTAGSSLGIEHSDGVFSPLTAANGICKLTPDGKVVLSFDIRASASFDLEEMAEKIHTATDVEWTIDVVRASKGFLHSEDDPRMAAIVETYERISGETGRKPLLIAGGTYARALKNAYSIGTVGYYKAPPIELPAGHGGVHQPDEKISIAGLLEALKILVFMILELDGVIN